MHEIVIGALRRCLSFISIFDKDYVKGLYFDNYDYYHPRLLKMDTSRIYTGNDDRSFIFTLATLIAEESEELPTKMDMVISVVETASKMKGYERVRQLYLQKFEQNGPPTKTQISNIISAFSVDSMIGFVFLLDYYYKYGNVDMLITTYNASVVPFDGYMKGLKRAYGINTSFEEYPAIKKGIKKLRKLVAQELAPDHIITGVDNPERFAFDEPSNLGVSIMRTFYYVNGPFHDKEPVVGSNHVRDIINPKYESVFNYLHYSRWVINIINSSMDKNYLTQHAEKAVNDALSSFLYTELSFKQGKANLPSMEEESRLPNQDSPIKEPLSVSTVNQIAINTDVTHLTQTCIWAVIMELTKLQNILYQEQFYDYEYARMQERESPLTTKIADLKKQLEEQKRQNDSLTQAFQLYKKERGKEAQNPNYNVFHGKELGEANRIIRKQQKEIASLKESLDNYKNQLQKQELKKEVSAPEEKKKICDCSRRYLFICQHPHVSKKLLEQFPNSVTSTNFEINKKTVKTIDAVVAITVSVSHSEYIRLKNQCSQYKLPFINCNNVNMGKICESIAEYLPADEDDK